MMNCADEKSSAPPLGQPDQISHSKIIIRAEQGTEVSKHQPNDLPAGHLDQWQQVSFIFFDLGAMNLIAGAGAAFFYSIPLSALGFRGSSFWLGLLFILIGLAAWKARRLPIVVPLIVIAIDLWNTVSLLPLYDRYGYVVLVQSSFVLPLVLMLLSMLRGRLKQGIFGSVGKESTSSTPAAIRSGREALALLTSMLVSVGMGLTVLLLFAHYCLDRIAEASNPLINIFHDLFLVPALLLLFPLGAALGELVWMRASCFYLNGNEISVFIRYLKQIPLISRIPDWILKRRTTESPLTSATADLSQTHFHQPVHTHTAINQRVWPKRLLWFAPLTLILLATGLMSLRPLEAFDIFHRVEASEETLPAPGTLVVSQTERGQYRSIRAAIADAAPGMTILVHPGVYHESVLINKAITLTGDERAAGCVTIECAEDGCVRLMADRATVRNLTVRTQLGLLARLLGSEEPTAIAILSGHALIENCDVSSNRGTGIVVSGSESEPEIRNVRVHDCMLNGMLFTNRSRGLVENSELYGNGWAGIRSDAGSQPVVRRSRIHHGQMDGVLIAMQGAGTFEECEIFENNYCGVNVREASSVALNHCRIFNQKRGGIFVHDRSVGRVEECEMFGNANAGIEIADRGDARVLKSKVHHGQTTGIIVWRDSTATMEESLIYENNSTGLLVAGGSKPIIRKCIFRSHIYSAIEVKEGGAPVFEQCQIYGGRSSGIYFHDGGNGRIEECSIFGNMGANVVIASGSNPQIQKSSSSESQQAGLLVTEGGRGVIEDCKIFNNYVGIEIEENGAPLVQHSKINNNRHQGVMAHGASAGSITGSELTGNPGGAWKLDNGSRLERGRNLE
jgi:parallel beta-helix repeat protein